MVDTSSRLSHQFLYFSPADTEKTYSGLIDGYAEAGTAGCKFIEFTGNNAGGDDVKALLNYAHYVIDFFPQLVTKLIIFPYQLALERD